MPVQQARQAKAVDMSPARVLGWSMAAIVVAVAVFALSLAGMFLYAMVRMIAGLG